MDTETTNTPSKEVPLFKNRTKNCAVILHDGTRVMFVNGRFFTTQVALQLALKNCADTREFGIFIDPKEPTIDPEASSPEDVLRKRYFAEFQAQLQAEARSGKLLEASDSVHGGAAGLQGSVVNSQSSELTSGGVEPSVPKVGASQTAKSEATVNKAQATLADRLKNK